MKFIPYPDKIEVQPTVRKTVVHMDKSFKESGLVLSVGADIKFVKPGDTLFFVAHGIWETPEDTNGVKHYVVSEQSEYILGKSELLTIDVGEK